MTAYRTYLLDRNEHINRMIEREAVSDADALRGLAALAVRCAAVEVWQGKRLVARFGAEFSLDLKG